MTYMFGNIMCSNHKRLPSILHKGDMIEALGHTGHNSGFSAEFEVRAVAHWGVYAKLLPSKYHSRKEEHMKKNWRIKWKNIFQYYLN
jgi:hypothetical protein